MIVKKISELESCTSPTSTDTILIEHAGAPCAITRDDLKDNLKSDMRNYTIPAGTFIWYTGTSVPTGFLICNGQAVSRTTYSRLYSAIGTKYGTGNGSTTFNVPDLTSSSYFVRAGGTSSVGTTETDTIRNITGTLYCNSVDSVASPFISASGAFSLSDNNSHIVDWHGDGTSYHTATFNASNSVPTASENRPVNIRLVPLIAY